MHVNIIFLKIYLREHLFIKELLFTDTVDNNLNFFVIIL